MNTCPNIRRFRNSNPNHSARCLYNVAGQAKGVCNDPDTVHFIVKCRRGRGFSPNLSETGRLFHCLGAPILLPRRNRDVRPSRVLSVHVTKGLRHSCEHCGKTSKDHHDFVCAVETYRPAGSSEYLHSIMEGVCRKCVTELKRAALNESFSVRDYEWDKGQTPRSSGHRYGHFA